jgi:hypothetical protein
MSFARSARSARFGVAALQSRPPKVCEVWGRCAPVTAANLTKELA